MSGISGIQTNSGYSRRASEGVFSEESRIASGKRIRTASDDAAGLAIAQQMERESRGLDVGANNTMDGMNLLNVADGALGGISDSLQRIRELSLQARNGLNGANELSGIQSEIDSLLQDIQSTAQGTEFNSLKLLDGSMADLNIASSPEGTDRKIQMENATLKELGIEGFDVTGSFNLDAIDQAIDQVNAARSNLGASYNALESTYNYNANASLQQKEAQSRIEDLDIGKAVSEKKKNDLLGEYQNIMLKKQMEQKAMITGIF